ncbi:MAG: hypothetical protein ACI8QZ_004284, partial [Chlamydiales bacterium]
MGRLDNPARDAVGQSTTLTGWLPPP